MSCQPCRRLVSLYERSFDLDVSPRGASLRERSSRCYSSEDPKGPKISIEIINPISPMISYCVLGGGIMLLAPVETTSRVHEQEWGQLIVQTAQGDQATLYDRTSPQVYGLALKILDNREAAEEVTLDVYTQVWRQAHTYDETRGTPGSWLMTLARTRAIDRYRAGAAERGRIESLDVVEFFASDGETPEQDLAGAERRRYVQQAMASLTVEQRKAITLAYFYGMSQSEIADKLQLPLGTVKTRMRLGMMKLRDALAPYQEGLVS